MGNRKGFGLILLLAGLVVIGILFYFWQNKPATQQEAGVSKASYPKQIIDKAKKAADKANARQADSERQLKDLGLQ